MQHCDRRVCSGARRASRLDSAIRFVALVGIVLGGISVPSAQEPKPLPVKGSNQVFVNLVQLDLLAVRSDGTPVTDLRPDELIVKEEGRPQKVAVFTRQREPGRDAPRPDARILFAVPDGGASIPAAGVDSRWFVLLFDLVHNDPRHREEMGQAARKFLVERMEPCDRVAVAVFDGSLTLVQNFTTDRMVLAASVDSALARPANASFWQSRLRELVAVLRGCQKEMVASRGFSAGRGCFAMHLRNYIRETTGATDRFIDALETSVRLLNGLKGRKYMMLFTHGVPLDPSFEAIEAARSVAGNNEQIQSLRFELSAEADHRPLLYRAIEKAVAAHVTIFTIDGSRAPTLDLGVQASDPIRKGALPYQVAFDTARDGLEEIARSTGGRFYGTPEFGANLAGAMAATDAAYTIGYYSELRHLRDPRDPIKVSVKCTRKGVRVTTRTWRLDPAISELRPLGRLEVGTVPDAPERRLVPFRIVLLPARFEPAETEEGVAISQTLHLSLRTKDGLSIVDSFHFLRRDYRKPEWFAGKDGEIAYDGALELPPGDYLFTVRIRDPRADATDERMESIHVAPPASAERTGS